MNTGSQFFRLTGLILCSIILFSCGSSSHTSSPLENYLNTKSVTIRDTTTVVVLGCISCSARPYDKLDSILRLTLQKNTELIFINTGQLQTISSDITQALSNSKYVRIYTETEQKLQDVGLYHRNPKVFVVAKDFSIVSKEVIKN